MEDSRTYMNRCLQILWRVTRPLLIAYLLLVLMFSLLERWLVFPAPPTNPANWNPANLPYEDVFFAAEDGTQLHGWYVPHSKPRAVVLHCHGNGEHVADMADYLHMLNKRMGLTVFAWDYRGYGRSHGKPTETNVIADTRSAQLWLADRAGVRPENVVLMGRSIGGAAAVAVAATNPVRGLVLDRTFSKLTDVAAYHFPWLPVRLMMRNRFSSIDRIFNYHGPLLQSHGTADGIIPFQMGKQLFDAAASEQKRFIEVPGGIHNSPLPEFCYEALGEFLDSLPPVEAKESPN